MTSFQRANFWSEIADLEAPIPEGPREYLRERLRNDLYDFVLRKFLEQRKERGLTKAQLARRIGYDPAHLNRLLGAPGNWTLSTVSDLLAGISGETLVPDSAVLPGRNRRNVSSGDLLNLTLSQDSRDKTDGAGSEIEAQPPSRG